MVIIYSYKIKREVIIMETKKLSADLDKYEKIIKALWYLILIAGGLVIVLLTAIAIFDSKTIINFGNSGFEFNLPGIQVSIDSSNISGPTVALTILTIAISILIWMLLVYSFYQFRKILQSTRVNGTPFINDNVKRIRNIGNAFLIYSLAEFGVQCIMSTWLSKLVLTGVKGIDISSKLSFPIWSLIVGIIILCIAQFFSYGFKLQQDNDSIV
jgi:hypothetical protein